jgi:hypothetical protein
VTHWSTKKLNTHFRLLAGMLAILSVVCFVTLAPADAQRKKIKIIADQDSGGPQGTNLVSLLMLLSRPGAWMFR